LNTAIVFPWIRKDKDDIGHRGHEKRIVFKGDFLSDSMFNPIRLVLELKEGDTTKQKVILEDVPVIVDPFIKAVKKQLGLDEKQNIKLFFNDEKGQEVEITDDQQIQMLNNKETVEVRLVNEETK